MQELRQLIRLHQQLGFGNLSVILENERFLVHVFPCSLMNMSGLTTESLHVQYGHLRFRNSSRMLPLEVP